jgi:hypothetical protein
VSLRADLQKALEHLEAAWGGEYRDAVVLTIGDTQTLVTGGISWGDSPGPTYDVVSLLEDHGILGELVTFPEPKRDRRDLIETRVTRRELATILAALRLWQVEMAKGDGPPILDHFADGVRPLNDGEIDRLCEVLNVGDHP